MKKIITPLLCWWVALVQRHAVIVMLVLLAMTAFSAFYTLQHFSIDSDLDKLVRQSEKHQWHANNQDYRRTFPDYHRNVVVVVSGVSAEQTFIAAETVYKALRDSQRFDDVFAPMFDDFVMDRVLYNIPTEGVRRLSDKVSETLPQLAVMYHQPSISNLLNYLQQQYVDASELEIMLPEIAYQLDMFSESVDQLLAGDSTQFHLIQKLRPRDTDDMHYQLITVKRAPQFTEKLPNKIIIDDMRAIIASLDIADGINVRITGEIAMMNDEISESISSFEFAGMVSVILLLVILGIGIRSKVLLAGIFIMLVMGVLFSVVFTLAVFEQFNTLSLVFVIMLFGLGIDFAVHFSLRLMEMLRTENTLEAACRTATRDAGVALGICAITTVIAFISFWPTDYLGLAELGVISAFGMITAYLLSLTFMPAWFVLMKIRPGKSLSHIHIPLPDVHIRYPARSILVISLILLIISGFYIRDMRFNYNLLSMRDQQSEAVKTLRELQDMHIVNSYTVAALIADGTDMAQLKAQLMALPTVAGVEVPEERLPMFQQAKQQYLQPVYQQLLDLGEPGQAATLNVDETRNAILALMDSIRQHQSVFLDSDKEVVDKLLIALQRLLDNEALWPLLQTAMARGVAEDIAQLKTWFSAEPYGLDDLPADIRKRLVSPGGRHLIQVTPAVDLSITDDNRRFIEEVMTVLPSIAGVAVHEWGVGQVVMHAFLVAASLSTSLIFLVLVIAFKRILPAVMIFIPMIMVAVFTLAIAKLSGIGMNMANILVVPLIFGLGVDTGIHVVHRYYHSGNWRETLYSSTGQAVLLSALTTIGAFIAIAFSPHQGAASIGVLLSVALSLLLVVTFIVLPALLMLFDPKKQQGH